MAVPLRADPDSGTPARSRLTKIVPGEEDTMHPDILRQFAAEHTRDLMTEAGEAVRAREARHTQRRRLAAHLRRSTRPAAALPLGAAVEMDVVLLRDCTRHRFTQKASHADK
jgi:hypothetical protein